jgi:hypothetical protein
MEHLNFILPTVILRIIDFVGLDEEKNIIFNSNDNQYALCKTLENKIILVRFLSNLKKITINENTIMDFFQKKALNSFKEQSVLKLAKVISKDTDLKKEKTKELKRKMKEKNPDMDDDDILMEVMEQLSQSFEADAKQIIIKDKTISKNSVIRIPLSASKKEIAYFQNKEFPIYESYSLLMSKEREPRESGMYLFSSNRHSIPLIFEKNKTGNYSIRFNGEFANKEILLTLLRHGLRTFKHTQGYMLTIFLKKGSPEDILEMVKKLNICSKSESEKNNYPIILQDIINWIEENENEKILIFRSSFIYLPKIIEKDLIFHGTLFDNLSKALLNVSLRDIDIEDKEQLLEDIEEELNSFFDDKKIYGFYNILYDIPENESNTYGFLENNIQSHQIMSGFDDTLSFYLYLQDKYKENLKRISSNEDNEPVLLEI